MALRAHRRCGVKGLLAAFMSVTAFFDGAGDAVVVATIEARDGSFDLGHLFRLWRGSVVDDGGVQSEALARRRRRSFCPPPQQEIQAVAVFPLAKTWSLRP